MNSSSVSAAMLKEAEICARAILKWHLEVGSNHIADKVQNRSEERRVQTVVAYREAVAEFSETDLSQRVAQQRLAKLQLSGIFEWFYGGEIPENFWANDLEYLSSSPPKYLHEAAHRILAIHERLPFAEERPLNKQHSSTEDEKKGRITVQFTGREELLRQVREVFPAYTREESKGIGGINFLLSCALERNPDTLSSNTITLFTSEFLGFKEDALEPEHFLNLLRTGKIRIDDARGD